MQSIVSYPDRGHWGDPKWRGNCSGRLYQDLFQQLQPRSFCDPMMGSGTSIEVAREMGIIHYGLDLHMGFNAIKDSILNTVGEQVDLCVSHPPYGEMIVYSGNIWGEPHPDDLSRCVDDEDFHRKLQLVLLNQRDATLPGGYYGTIIGDYRRKGVYTSYQAEAICRMPKDELAAVLIKQQHNCLSDTRKYARMTLPRVVHEYVLLWQKKSAPVLILLKNLATQQHQRVVGTWRNVVSLVLQRLGGKAALNEIYAEVARAVPDRLSQNEHWQAKVRQILNSNKDFMSSERGVWQMA